jgi:acetolactate decarboxylase
LVNAIFGGTILNKLWQNMPSMVFKTGFYDGVSTVHQAKEHGNFGVGQFAALDGELTVVDGCFFRAKSDGSVRLADDSDELCFAQLCFYQPEQQWEAPSNVTDESFGTFLSSVMSFRNSFCAFRITGLFANIVPTSPPALQKPYPPFANVGALRKSFPATNIAGCIVGYYSPAFAADTGIPGYHFHFISDDRLSAGHVTSFSLSAGHVDAARVNDFILCLPQTSAYDSCNLL